MLNAWLVNRSTVEGAPTIVLTDRGLFNRGSTRFSMRKSTNSDACSNVSHLNDGNHLSQITVGKWVCVYLRIRIYIHRRWGG